MNPTISLIYAKLNIVINAALKHMENLSTMDDLDSESTIEELSKDSFYN